MIRKPGMTKHLGLAAIGLLVTMAGAQAAPLAASGYSFTTFAPSRPGTSGADSVEVVGGNVYVGYSNGTPKDGSAGTSTIVEYSGTGAFMNSTTIAGHTDGLRYDPTSGMLWSMQNEDANGNLVLITPGTLAKSSVFSYSAAPHGGGYDDAVFVNGHAFVTASAPGKDPNSDPALVKAQLGAGIVNVTGVLNGNAPATALNKGAPTTLNLQDPDSLSQTKDGRVVMTSQADSLLLFLTNPGTASQSVGSLKLQNGVQVDDTAFAGTFDKTLLVADKTTNAIYAITGPFGFNTGYSAALDASGNGFVGALNLDGSFTPILTGLGNPAGEAFLAVPEPASMMMLGTALLGLIGLRNKRRAAPPHPTSA
jgi:hypothetical protein